MGKLFHSIFFKRYSTLHFSHAKIIFSLSAESKGQEGRLKKRGSERRSERRSDRASERYKVRQSSQAKAYNVASLSRVWSVFGLARTVCKQAGQMSSSHVKLAGPRAGLVHNWAYTNLYSYSLTLHPATPPLATAISLPFSDTFTAVNALKVFEFYHH